MNRKKIKLTRQEYEYLKTGEGLGGRIARNKDNSLIGTRATLTKGYKYEEWVCMYGERIFCLDEAKDLFKFIKWEDERPYLIDDILANCEVVDNG